MIVESYMSLGDEICLTPAVRKLRCRVRPRFPEIWQGNPHNLLATHLDTDSDTRRVTYQTDFSTTMVENFAKQLGVDLEGYEKVPWVIPERFFEWSSGFTHIAIDTEAGWPTRRWPKERFEELAERLRIAGMAIMAVGAPNVHQIGGSVGPIQKGKPFNFYGTMTIRETAAILEHCDLFVGNDSGLAHLAAAVGTKSVVIFGPVEERCRRHEGLTFGVTGGRCSGCVSKGKREWEIVQFGCPAGHMGCIMDVTVDMVMERIEGVLGWR